MVVPRPDNTESELHALNKWAASHEQKDEGRFALVNYKLNALIIMVSAVIIALLTGEPITQVIARAIAGH